MPDTIRATELAELDQLTADLLEVTSQLPEGDPRKLTHIQARTQRLIVLGLPELTSGLAVFWAQVRHNVTCPGLCRHQDPDFDTEIAIRGSGIRQELERRYQALPIDRQRTLASRLTALLRRSSAFESRLAWNLIVAEQLRSDPADPNDEPEPYPLDDLRAQVDAMATAMAGHGARRVSVWRQALLFAETGGTFAASWVGEILADEWRRLPGPTSVGSPDPARPPVVAPPPTPTAF